MPTRNTLLALCIFSASAIYAQEAEKKVDYLEKIYFSGKNKEELHDMILVTVSQMGSRFDSTMLPSPAYLKQYVFLKNIAPQAQVAKDACDVLELLAVGIREMDIEEAIAQKIKQPSPEATKSSADALAGITKVNNSISATNSALNTLAWNQYLLSGNAVGFGALNKVGGAAGTVGAAAGAVSAGKELLGAAKGLGLGKGKDKPCKDVTAKEITLGEHKFTPAAKPTASDVKEFSEKPPITAPGTALVINNINFNQLSTVMSAIEKIPGVSAVDNEGFSGNIASLKIRSTVELMKLLNEISKAVTPLKLEVNSIDPKNNGASMTLKS